ncbi:MAG TPA: outer membrane beta-barrel domain-containing protein [Polyangiaceae bacterium]
MAPRLVSLFALPAVAVALLAFPGRAQAQCVDEALKQQLVGDRAYRGVVPRVFKKALRHELSALGGWFAGDLSDGAPAYGGAYTFHFTEDLGLEASYVRSRESFALLNALQGKFAGQVQFTPQPSNPVQFFMGHLLWSMAYGKVRWLGGGISRYDFFLALGGGAIVEPGDRGLTGSGGFGMKFYLNDWLALRWDARDAIHQMKREQLGVEKIVNDLTVLGGFSVFIPFKS